MTTMGELKAIVDALHDLHGPDIYTTFVFQKSYGKIGNGDITSYKVGFGLMGSVQFHIDSPLGRGADK